MSFDIDEWKQRFSSSKDAETRCQMLKADGLVISQFIARDPLFMRWMLNNRLDDDGHSMALYCYKEQLSGDNEIVRCFKFPIRQTQFAILDEPNVRPLWIIQGLTDRMNKLIKLYIEHYYISCAVGVKIYKGLQIKLDADIQKLQHEICLLKGNSEYQTLQPLYKDLRTKINMLVTKLVDEIITTDHWSCQLVTELVMFVI